MKKKFLCEFQILYCNCTLVGYYRLCLFQNHRAKTTNTIPNKEIRSRKEIINKIDISWMRLTYLHQQNLCADLPFNKFTTVCLFIYFFYSLIYMHNINFHFLFFFLHEFRDKTLGAKHFARTIFVITGFRLEYA